MTLTMIDIEATEDLDFSPVCDIDGCDRPVTHRVDPVGDIDCRCIYLLCTACAAHEAADLEDWADWRCNGCGFEAKAYGADLWQVREL